MPALEVFAPRAGIPAHAFILRGLRVADTGHRVRDQLLPISYQVVAAAAYLPWQWTTRHQAAGQRGWVKLRRTRRTRRTRRNRSRLANKGGSNRSHLRSNVDGSFLLIKGCVHLVQSQGHGQVFSRGVLESNRFILAGELHAIPPLLRPYQPPYFAPVELQRIQTG